MDLPNPGIEPGSPALQVDSLPTELSGKPIGKIMCVITIKPMKMNVSIRNHKLAIYIYMNRKGVSGMLNEKIKLQNEMYTVAFLLK